MKEIKLKISGMHCSSCEKIIQMDLEDIKGVLESKIDSKNGSGFIKVEDFVLEDSIIKAVDDAGYKAQLVGE